MSSTHFRYEQAQARVEPSCSRVSSFISSPTQRSHNVIEREPHLKTPFQTPRWINQLSEASKKQVEEVAVMVEEQALKVVEEVEWAMPYEMELGYSFCSSNVIPEIKG